MEFKIETVNSSATRKFLLKEVEKRNGKIKTWEEYVIQNVTLIYVTFNFPIFKSKGRLDSLFTVILMNGQEYGIRSITKRKE